MSIRYCLQGKKAGQHSFNRQAQVVIAQGLSEYAVINIAEKLSGIKNIRLEA
jgi:hypothetical protein